jgi:enoyl-CoA hydratase/carnithine racemase
MAAQYETLSYRKEGQLGRLELRRPERLNAVAMTGARELLDVAGHIAKDADLRMVAITGQGRAFSTGIDLKDLADGKIDLSYFDLWDSALRVFETMDKLVLCLIHGYAIGGGLQLGLAADVRVCTRSAKLGLPAIKEGLIPGLGTWRLARYVGMGRAKSLIIRGNMIDGVEAERIGLVDHLIDDDNPEATFEDWISDYAKSNSAGCRYSKEMLLECFDLGYDAFFEKYLELQKRSTDAADFAEAMAAYHEDRPPVWG